MESIESKIDALCSIILKTDAEDWEKRNKAMLQLTDIVVSFSDESTQAINDAFTASVFRTMKEPVKNMILDLRSQQVRDTCHFLVKLAEVTGDRMKPFLRDSFSTILEGVKIPHKVTSGYIDECIVFLIKHVTFKCAIVLVMHEIKESKSKIMRERCLEYINLILVHWDITDKELDFFVDAIKLGLEDAAVRAREISRAAYLNMFNLYPEKAEKIKSLLPKAYQQKLTRTEEEGLTDLPSSPGGGPSSLSSSLNSSGLLKVGGTHNNHHNTAAAGHADSLSTSMSSDTSFASSSAHNHSHSLGTNSGPKSHKSSHTSSAKSTVTSATTTAKTHSHSHTGAVPSHTTHARSTPHATTAHPAISAGHMVSASLENADVLPVPPPKKKPAPVVHKMKQPQSSEGVSSKFERIASSSGCINLLASSASMDATNSTRSSEENAIRLSRQGSLDHLVADPAPDAQNTVEQAVLSIQARMRGTLSRRRSIVHNPFAALAASSPEPASEQKQQQQQGTAAPPMLSSFANSAGSLSSGASGNTSHATRSTASNSSQPTAAGQSAFVSFAATTKVTSGGSVHSASSTGSHLRTPTAAKKTGIHTRSSHDTPAFSTSTAHTISTAAGHQVATASSRKTSTGSADSAPTPRSISAARSPRPASTSALGATPSNRSRSASKTRTTSSSSLPSPAEKVAPGVRAVRYDEVASADSTALFPKELSINMRVNVVTTRDGRLPGLIKFIGHTAFSPGMWIGVSLDAPVGKNDGSVQGRRYFDCPTEHGLFVKEDVVERVSNLNFEGEPRQSNGSLNGSFTHGSVERDAFSTSSRESPSAASSVECAEKKGSITGLLKLKLSQMMEMLNHQLEIVVQLEEEDRNRPSSATHYSKHAGELYAEIVRVTNQEQNLINAFKQHLHDRLN